MSNLATSTPKKSATFDVGGGKVDGEEGKGEGKGKSRKVHFTFSLAVLFTFASTIPRDLQQTYLILRKDVIFIVRL